MKETRILIVEDDGIIAERLKNVLSQLGYKVMGAVASGEEAIGKNGSEIPGFDIDGHLPGG